MPDLFSFAEMLLPQQRTVCYRLDHECGMRGGVCTAMDNPASISMLCGITEEALGLLKSCPKMSSPFVLSVLWGKR